MTLFHGRLAAILYLFLALCGVHAAAADLDSLPVNRWVKVTGTTCHGGLQSYSRGCPSPRGWIQLAYDSKREKVVLFGGSGEWYFNDLWNFDPRTRRWDLVMQDTKLAEQEKDRDWSRHPKGRDNHQFIYDPAHDVYWMYGGTGNGGFWKFEPQTKTWTRLAAYHDGKQLPIGTLDPGFAIAPELDKILLFGGEKYNYDDATWLFDTEQEKWQKLGVSSHPVGRGQAENAMAYDPKRQQFLLFGGRIGGGKELDDTWIFDMKTRSWKEITAGPRPPARQKHMVVYDRRNDVYIMWGGARAADTWLFDPDAGRWRELESARGSYDPKKAPLGGGVYMSGLDLTVFRDVAGQLYYFRLDPKR